MKVSCDLNYRKNLWKYGKTASEIMQAATQTAITAALRMPRKYTPARPAGASAMSTHIMIFWVSRGAWIWGELETAKRRSVISVVP